MSKIKSTFKDNSGAYFSLYRNKRYCLWRIWDRSKPLIMFIGLNPSIADEKSNDPTIRRVIKFADDWGYGGVYMLNLFPFIETNSKKLKPYSQAAMVKNDAYLKHIGNRCQDVVFAWGKNPYAKLREKQIQEMFPNAKCLCKNNDGSPRHPLYVPSNTKLINYT